VRWSFQAAAEIRGAVIYRSAPLSGDSSSVPGLFFGDVLGNAYALNAQTGGLLWKVRVDDHPAARISGTPALWRDRLYVPVSGFGEETAAGSPDYACCTFRGSMVALDPSTGALRWKRHSIQMPAVEQSNSTAAHPRFGPSGASLWGSPAFDAKRDLLYFGTGNNFSDPPDDNSDALFAVDAASGEIRWKKQFTAEDAFNVGCARGLHESTCPKQPGPDLDFAAPPLLAHGADGRDLLIGGQKSGDIFAVDPETGSLIWHAQISHDPNPWSGGLWYGMSLQDGRLMVPTSSQVAPQLPVHSGQLWLKSPVNGLHALDVSSGRILWSAPASQRCQRAECTALATAPLSIPGAVLAGSLDGVVHAFDPRTGHVFWNFNTSRAFKSVNGETARGEALIGAGSIFVADGVLYVISAGPKTSVLLALSNGQSRIRAQ
jgi:polyvinyl alcohol dehydrogenase (cytochrome)